MAEGFSAPSLASEGYGVALVGDALASEEVGTGQPLSGRAGHKLTRLIEWSGYDRGKFDIWNVIWCHPPKGQVDGQLFERPATAHCRTAHWGSLLDRVRVVVPMGNVALAALTGRKGILTERGYVTPGPNNTYLLPTVHPIYIQRGQSRYSAAFINDLDKAVRLARDGMPFVATNYVLDPLPVEALAWATEYRARLANDPTIRLAYDIETPGKGEDEAEVDEDDDRTFIIHRIGFSYAPNTGMSIPWAPEYYAAIKLLMESPGEKVVWNAGFDNPRITARGVRIEGLVHDGMVAWHILHSDLPKGLRFVATFTCPWQPAWKHLSQQRPAYYNVVDADVEGQSMSWIEHQLRLEGLWPVYQHDVIDLDPVLKHMTAKGMPIDHDVRVDRALKLAQRRAELLAEMEAAYPMEARKVEHVYKDTPADTTGLLSRPGRREVATCDRCGLEWPTKPHFRTFKRPSAKKPQNPCAGAGIVVVERDVVEWYRLAPFTPSRDQLMRYQTAMGRNIPTKWDAKSKTRKSTMDEKAIEGLRRRFPRDTFYPLVLEYRNVDKIAGTYVGRPVDQA